MLRKPTGIHFETKSKPKWKHITDQELVNLVMALVHSKSVWPTLPGAKVASFCMCVLIALRKVKFLGLCISFFCVFIPVKRMTLNFSIYYTLKLSTFFLKKKKERKETFMSFFVLNSLKILWLGCNKLLVGGKSSQDWCSKSMDKLSSLTFFFHYMCFIFFTYNFVLTL